MSVDKQQKHDNDQPDYVDIGGDTDWTWVCDGIFDMWGKTSDNRWTYQPSKPSK